MRILHIIASANLKEGGPIEHAVKAGHALARRGHSQEFLTFDSPGSVSEAEVGSPIHALGPRRPRRGWAGKIASALLDVPRATQWLRAHGQHYDVAIVSGLWNISTLTARLALPGGRLPYVLFTHGMLDPYFRQANPVKSWIKQALWLVNEGILVRRADRVLFTCEEEQQLAAQSFRPYSARGRVVAFGTADAPPDAVAQVEAFRTHIPELDSRRFLLFLSRLHPKKGLDLLIRAFAGAVREAVVPDDVDLVIAGPDLHGLGNELKELAEAEGISARVHWPGMLKGDPKWGAFRAAEAFILSSHQENFGIVVAEAMACGRPVLLSNKVNIWREVAADGAGLIADDTLEGTEDLLRRFFGMSEQERHVMGEDARAAFLRRYDMESAIEDLEHLLGEVIEGSHRPARTKTLMTSTL
ncbi:glycosyltransferase [soil metagenome]